MPNGCCIRKNIVIRPFNIIEFYFRTIFSRNKSNMVAGFFKKNISGCTCSDYIDSFKGTVCITVSFLLLSKIRCNLFILSVCRIINRRSLFCLGTSYITYGFSKHSLITTQNQNCKNHHDNCNNADDCKCKFCFD